MKALDVRTLAQEAKQVFLPNRYQKPFTKPFQALTGREVPVPEGRQNRSYSNP